MSDDKHNAFAQMGDAARRNLGIIVALITMVSTTAVNFYRVGAVETKVEGMAKTLEKIGTKVEILKDRSDRDNE